jgi:hypothetical protein
MTYLPHIYLTREAERLGTGRELRALHSRGAVVRLATGAFIDRSAWESLDSDGRYRARVHAAALISSPGAQFSHDSAAALWRLPSIGRWPVVSHELIDRSAGGTSRVGIARHALGRDPLATVVDGVLVTSLTRTLIDMAATAPFVRSVAMIDDGLRMPRPGDFRDGLVIPTQLELLGAHDALLPFRGSTRARRAICFGDGRSGSPLESFSRVQFSALGYPAPEQQVRFDDEFGFIGVVDFYWRELGLIVETDGDSKYTDARKFQRDMTLEQVLRTEKQREDRLRRQSRSFARIGWALASDRRALAAFLRPHGLVASSRAAFG